MEVEVKYFIDDDTKISSISEDETLKALECKDTRELHCMRAVYYDTLDKDLGKIKAAFRVRLEGNLYVATMKMNGKVVDGIHQRFELNEMIFDDEFVENPSLKIFEGNEEVRNALGDAIYKPIEPILEMNYVRELFDVEYESSTMEVALDQGDIWTPAGNAPICELELELHEGNVEDLKSLGDIISKTYDLKPESRSKFARGLELISE